MLTSDDPLVQFVSSLAFQSSPAGLEAESIAPMVGIFNYRGHGHPLPRRTEGAQPMHAVLASTDMDPGQVVYSQRIDSNDRSDWCVTRIEQSPFIVASV